MPNNRLVIASAGSGKTTYLVDQALQNPEERVLITTYTEANEAVIRKRILSKRKSIPSNITIQTWFSFLIQHGVRPYQGALDEMMFDKDVRGLLLVNQPSARFTRRLGGRTISVPWKEEDYFEKHYFSNSGKIYSDKLSKFVSKADVASGGMVFSRLESLYDRIYIDEVQDLAGYDLEIIKSMFKSSASILLVGDPRQVTYLTHHERKHSGYTNGRIKEFLLANCKRLIGDGVDEKTLIVSHRNNQTICDYSSKLYPDLPSSTSCSCLECRVETEHEGIVLIRPSDVEEYLSKFSPIQLRWDKRKEVNTVYPMRNFGESKGETFNRVIIYPTTQMTGWMKDNNYDLKPGARAKFYVGITRAKHSVAIVYDFGDSESLVGVEKYIKD